MPSRHNVERALAAALLTLASGSCRAEDAAPAGDRASHAPLGLMGTLPLYWGEQEAFGDVLSDSARPHWARAQLEARYTLRPLDTLSETTLADLDFLLLAQPRALSGPENVALDSWVRAGGRLLLFADPLLTGATRFGIGDRRRPQDVILLSPILDHWGLRLQFDEDQPTGFRLVGDTVQIPVNLSGHFLAEGPCEITAQGVLARCAIGKGQVVVLADAALLELAAHPAAAAAFGWLLEQGF